MAPLTWRNVDSPSFASANQLYSLSAELMNRGFSAASRGLDKFRETTTDEQSARLMQDVIAAGNDPAAIQAAASRGNAAFLSPEALRFANNQPGILLDRQQAETNTDIMQYGLDRSKVADNRYDAQYSAQQDANPLIYQAQQLARQGDLSGAQGIVSANADLFSRAWIDAGNLYGDLSGGYTGQMTDTERGVQHGDFLRIAGNAGNARELIDLAGRSFSTEADARRGIQDLQAQGLINADLAQTALGSLSSSGLWTPATAADEIMQRYGAAPMSGRGSTPSNWAASIGLVKNESGGNWRALNDEGYGGRLQFGEDRLADAARAGVIPAGVTGAEFSRMSPKQQQRVEDWHFDDIDRQAIRLGLDRYYGQVIDGVPITQSSIRSMAHLGGIDGARRFIESNGKYNPADSNGTRLSDYGSRYSGIPSSSGSNASGAATQPRASVYDQMMADAVNGSNRAPLTFGDNSGGVAPTTQAAEMGGLVGRTMGNRPAPEASNTTTPLVASPQTEDSEAARRANQMMAQVLAQPVEDVKPAQIVEAGTSGNNPLFTEVDGGVVARPPMNQQESLLLSRAAQAGVLRTSPERTARQQEIDRVSDLMREATDIAPNAKRSYLQPGGLLSDMGMMGAQTGEAVVNQGKQLLDKVNAPFRMLSEYALGRDYIGGTDRVDLNGDGYSQSLTSPITGTTQDNLTPEQRKAMTGSDSATNAMNAALSSNENAGQQPVQGQQPDQQAPAATPTRPAKVEAAKLASFIQTAANTGNADRANDLHAALDRAVVEGDSGDANLGELASRLRTEEGGLSDYSHQDIEGALNRIRSELGVSLPVAAELLGDSRKYEGTDWNPLNWGGDLQYDMGDIRDRWKLYDQGNSSNAARLQAAVARLNNRDTSQSASQGIAQVQADYEALVTAMNQQITQASTQAERDAIREHFERNVFPLLYEQVQAIGATGALTTYSGTRTDQ